MLCSLQVHLWGVCPVGGQLWKVLVTARFSAVTLLYNSWAKWKKKLSDFTPAQLQISGSGHTVHQEVCNTKELITAFSSTEKIKSLCWWECLTLRFAWKIHEHRLLVCWTHGFFFFLFFYFFYSEHSQVGLKCSLYIFFKLFTINKKKASIDTVGNYSISI